MTNSVSTAAMLLCIVVILSLPAANAQIPSWFTHNTQLCFRWRPDGDGGQCGAGEPQVLCSYVGHPTAAYRDDTDGRGGGCRMQWGIWLVYSYIKYFSRR